MDNDMRIVTEGIICASQAQGIAWRPIAVSCTFSVPLWRWLRCALPSDQRATLGL